MGLDDKKGRQELRDPSLFSHSVIKDAFDTFDHDFQAANLPEGKYIKPPPSTAKWYKVGQPCYEEKMQELNTDFAKICITPKPPGAPTGKVPLPILKELEHQARQNISTLTFTAAFAKTSSSCNATLEKCHYSLKATFKKVKSQIQKGANPERAAKREYEQACEYLDTWNKTILIQDRALACLSKSLAHILQRELYTMGNTGLLRREAEMNHQESRGMGIIDRPIRRFPSHLHPPKLKEIPRVLPQVAGVPVHLPPSLPSHSPPGLYNDCKGSEANGPVERTQTSPIPGQLADQVPVSGGSPSEHSGSGRPNPVLGVDNKSGKIRTKTYSGGLRIPSRFSPCKTHSREMAQTSGFDPTTKDCKMFDVANWVACLNGENGPRGTPSHETLSVTSQGGPTLVGYEYHLDSALVKPTQERWLKPQDLIL